MRNKRVFFKKGISLVETIVAIALFVLGIQSTVLIFSKTIKSKTYTLEMGKSALILSRSMGDLTRYIRKARQSDNGAYPIVSADDNDLILYSDYNKDGKTERLHIYLSNKKIYLGIRNPSSSFPISYASGDGQTIQLADHIINSAADPMFSYYNADYPQDTVNNPVSTPADVSEIRLVKMFLKINIDENRAPDNIQQETFIEIRNLNDYDRIH
jgi:hypothetical protein